MFTLLQPKADYPLEDIFGTELAKFTSPTDSLKPQGLTLVQPFESLTQQKPFYLHQEEAVIANQVFKRPDAGISSVELYSIIFNAQTMSHAPVLVFPERLPLLHKKPARAKKMHYRNCSFLVDILSLTDVYGNAVRKTAVYLLENNLIHFFGLEYENLRYLKDARCLRITKRVADLLSENVFSKIKSLDVFK